MNGQISFAAVHNRYQRDTILIPTRLDVVGGNVQTLPPAMFDVSPTIYPA